MQGLRVLLVEDQPDVAAVTVDMLEGSGCRVTWVADGAAALETARGELFDFVLTDVRLPGEIDGHALAHEIARISPGTPVLLCSGVETPGAAPAGLLLPKPYDSERLIGAMRCIL